MYSYLYNNSYSIMLGILILINGFLFFHLVNTRAFGRKERWIVMLVVAGTICALSDALCVLLQGKVGRIGFWFLNATFNASFSATGCIMVMYLESSFYKKKNHLNLIFIPFILLCVLNYTTIFTGLVFSIDEFGQYTRGPLYMFAFFVLCLGYVFYIFFKSIIRAIIYRSVKELRPLGYILPYLGGTFIQFFITTFPFGNAGLTITMLFVYADNIENLLITAYENEYNERKANREKTSFLARMSHDIRTPINGIVGLVDIMSDHPDDEELIRENLVKAKQAANHLLSLVNDVLEMSKLEEGKFNFEERSVDLLRVGKEIITVATLRAEKEGITIDYDLGNTRECPYVLSNESCLRQLYSNLITNAIKYNKPGGSIYINHEVINKTDDSFTLRTKIKDTGIGMKPEFLEHIFEPFSQAKNDARSNYEGTGLGMSIVKSLVDNIGGKIDISSTYGVGTEIVVEVPFKIDHNPEDQSFFDLKKEDIDINGVRVLLVEDNELNREIAQFQLESHGCLVTLAVDGEDACTKFANSMVGSFDIILMDIMMPKIDGYEASKAIRMMDRKDAPNVPIVALSANAFFDDMHKAQEAGMNEYLSKPIDEEKLLRVIYKYCIFKK